MTTTHSVVGDRKIHASARDSHKPICGQTNTARWLFYPAEDPQEPITCRRCLELQG